MLFQSFGKQNILLTGLFGLPLLLGPTQTLVKGLAIGLLLSITILFLSISIHFVQPLITRPLRIIVYVLLSALIVSLLDFTLKATFYELSLTLGVYVPIIAMSSLVFCLLEEQFIKPSIANSAIRPIRLAAFCIILFSLIGALREIISSGTLFNDANLLYLSDSSIKLHAIEFSIFSLLPGAMFIFAFLLAFKNHFHEKS